MTTPIRTTCPYCGVGCGIIVEGEADNLTIKGDPDHPANFGRLCSKGSNLAQTISHEGRLLSPEINGEQVSWDHALDSIADKFKSITAEHGPEAIAFYLSGQLLTEDYYVVNKLAKGFIGTPNVDTNSRLCMASSVAGHKRAFGYDTVPACYEDLDIADLVVAVGSNMAWCHPILFQRIQKNRTERGAKLVTIDVRETATTKESDLALILKPGTDATLFNGLLSALVQSGSIDEAYMTAHCEGYQEAISTAIETAGNPMQVAEICGLELEDVHKFYALYCNTEKSVTCYSMGIHMSSSGTDKVNAILNCHLATGRIGKPGAGPLSLTGQPNAMGGREVGGLANQLAAHMGYDEQSIDITRRFWNAPNMATGEGMKAVDLFNALDEGRIKAIWIQSTNPAVSMTNVDLVRRALDKCDFVIVSDCVSHTDTLDFANVKLPAASWGEKNGTVTNSERRISRQRAFMDPPGQSKPDWWMVNEVAKRMGYETGFQHENVGEVFNEHADFSGFENNGVRDFDISGLSKLTAEEFEKFAPIQWPVNDNAPNGQSRMFADGKFFRPGAKALMLPIMPKLPIDKTSAEFPLIATTGRLRDQWHTMTRTGRSAILSLHRPEPFVEISSEDAKKYNLVHMGLAEIKSTLAKVIFRVRVTDDQPTGTIFIPIHWSATNSSEALAGKLFASNPDPFSGQPEGKFVPVSMEPVTAQFSGLIISRQPVDPKLPIFWSRAQSTNCYLHSLAIQKTPEQGWPQRVAEFLSEDVDNLTTYEDKSAGIFRAARFKDGVIDTAIFISPGYEPLEEIEAERWFNSDSAAKNDRWMALSPKPMDGGEERGQLICACFGVGMKAIEEAIISGKATTTEEIGELLNAGTNCGSCVPEIKQIIQSLK